MPPTETADPVKLTKDEEADQPTGSAVEPAPAPAEDEERRAALDTAENDVDALRRRVSKLHRTVGNQSAMIAALQSGSRPWRWLAIIGVWAIAGGIITAMLLTVGLAEPKAALGYLWLPLLAAVVATWSIAES